jgi:hypothetical protein
VIGGLSKATRFDFPVEIFKCMRRKKKQTAPIGRIDALLEVQAPVNSIAKSFVTVPRNLSIKSSSELK